MTLSLDRKLDAAEIHRRLTGRWPAVLEQLGIAPEYLCNRHGPCPACGGTDRYRFDDKHQRGDYFCNACGAGDGFKLLQLVHRWTFAETWRAVVDVLGAAASDPIARRNHAPPSRATSSDNIPFAAAPTARVKTLLRTSATPDAVPDAIAYLKSRDLWPLPRGCTWRAHAGVDYYLPGLGKSVLHVGRFPALVAAVRDIAGEAVTAHLCYLQDGAKLTGHDPRKILSSMIGRRGCAVRLLPLVGDVLGIAEGIETALAARAMHDDVPVWAALNATMLAKFEPPTEVRRLLIFADRDVAGLEAAWRLRDRLGDRCKVELRLPPTRAGDWADELEAQQS